MASTITSSLTTGFVDLATYDEIERYLYGGEDATAYMVRAVEKSTWFTQVPVALSRANGSPAFGADWSVNISRAGDYLLYTWLRLTLPSVSLSTASTSPYNQSYLRWVPNVMHNIVRLATITFNDLIAAKFDSYHLDFWAAFTVPAGKQNGYANMIGNLPALISPTLAGTDIPSATLNLPLPFWFARDTGISLPTAALPYNEMRINFSFRDYTELLLVNTPTVGSQPVQLTNATYLNATPVLGQCNVWANYAIVSNDERKKMACAPRDILIEQVQCAPHHNYNPTTNPYPSFDIRFSYSIKVLFFAVRNNTTSNEYSNYTTLSSYFQTPSSATNNIAVVTYPGLDPILETSLIYENMARLAQMGSDYFSLVNPYYTAPVIPTVTGYHLYSYALDFVALDPMGSTNYGKLTNVSIQPTASSAAIAAASSTNGSNYPYEINQKYEFIITGVNWNIIRISGGMKNRDMLECFQQSAAARV